MKIQSYASVTSYLKKATEFWKVNEAMNGLFWELTRSKANLSLPKKYFNVFENGKVVGSALITSASYLLLSTKTKKAVKCLVKYIQREKIYLAGALGSRPVLESFYQYYSSKRPKSVFSPNKEFIVFQSPTSELRFKEDRKYNLEQATTKEWPRVANWSKSFAHESIPPLNPQRSLALAKEMYSLKRLFVLKSKDQRMMAMGGFGRETMNALVINMVYVQPECRGAGVGRMLVYELVKVAEKWGYSHCNLFSDYNGEENLYAQVGFKKKGTFCEISF